MIWTAFNSTEPNPYVLTVALVGGPDADDSYQDIRSDYLHNEVALGYNAAFQSTVVSLLYLKNNGFLIKKKLLTCTVFKTLSIFSKEKLKVNSIHNK
jgi:hypothetical protein